MADRYYTSVLGAGLGNATAVTEGGAATPANAFDFRVTYDATGVTKLDVLRALEGLMDYITQDNWPPV